MNSQVALVTGASKGLGREIARAYARAGLRLSNHGVVLENGRVRLAGTGREVLEHPEIGALYLGGAVTPAGSANGSAADPANGAVPGAAC